MDGGIVAATYDTHDRAITLDAGYFWPATAVT